jgi:glycosyltransferase involved in cell wall biosynthesis
LEAAQVGTPIITSKYTPWTNFSEDFSGIEFADLTPLSIRFFLQKVLLNYNWDSIRRDNLSRSIITHFSQQKMIDNYINCYEYLLRK